MFSNLSGAAVIALAIGAGVVYGVQDQQELQKDSTKFMQRKLINSREIVAGLALEDYPLIAKSAQDLMLLSHEADWNVIQTKPYLDMSGEFRGAAQRLRDAAKGKNLDGATLAYFEVTLSCVRCHKYVRQQIREEKK